MVTVIFLKLIIKNKVYSVLKYFILKEKTHIVLAQ
jgi:hypothetical protein